MLMTSGNAPQCPISRKLYMIRAQKLKLLIKNHTTALRWYDCRWTWRYFKVIRLFHVKFLVNSAWYGKSYHRLLIGNHTLAFDWCHFWWPWRTFEGHFSLGCHFHGQYLRNYTRYAHSYWIRNYTRAFEWYVHCRWPCRYFQSIRLFHIKFLVSSALYGKSYYGVQMANRTLVFAWCYLDFEGHFSLGCHSEMLQPYG